MPLALPTSIPSSVIYVVTKQQRVRYLLLNSYLFDLNASIWLSFTENQYL